MDTNTEKEPINWGIVKMDLLVIGLGLAAIFMPITIIRWLFVAVFTVLALMLFKAHCEAENYDPHRLFYRFAIFEAIGIALWFFHVYALVPCVIAYPFIYLLYGEPTKRFEEWYKPNARVEFAIDLYRELQPDGIKRRPEPPADVAELERLSTTLPAGQTYGTPGGGVATVEKFGDRAKYGAKGERILAGLVAKSGLLENKNVFTFWSLESPDTNFDIDVDCVIMYGDMTWMLDAKYYTPVHENDYMIDQGGPDGKGELILRNMSDDDWKHIWKIRDESIKDSHGVEIEVPHFLQLHTEDKKYAETRSDEISLNAFEKIFPYGDEVKAYVVLVPTDKGTPGVMKETRYPGYIDVDQATAVISEIKEYVDTHSPEDFKSSQGHYDAKKTVYADRCKIVQD
jgi:hypothetical protein